MRTVALSLALLCCASATAVADVAGIAIPSRSRQVTANHHISGRTFRKTVVFFRKQLSKRGYQHQEIPIYGYRGVLVARFIAQGKDATWNAVHIFRLKGKTHIYIVPNAPPLSEKPLDRPTVNE